MLFDFSVGDVGGKKCVQEVGNGAPLGGRQGLYFERFYSLIRNLGFNLRALGIKNI